MSQLLNCRKFGFPRSESLDSPHYVKEREINGAIAELHESRWGNYDAHKNNWHEILGLSQTEYKNLSHLRKDALKAQYWAELRQEYLDSVLVESMRSALPNEFTYCGQCPNIRELGGDRLVCKLSGEVVRKKWSCQL
jgi:hypothetical protein